MVTKAAVQAEVTRWIGWREGPNNDQSSGGNWGARQGVGNGYAYCNSGADMTTYDCGYRHYPECTYKTKGEAYVPTTQQRAIEHGDFIWDHSSTGQPADLEIGDRPIYSWDGNSVPDHIGAFIVAVYADGTFDCVEFNTGSPEGCHLIRRDRKYLLGVHRLRDYESDSSAPIKEGWMTGSIAIISSLSRKVLDIAGAKNFSGAELVQWTLHGGLNQLWVPEVDSQGIRFHPANNLQLSLDGDRNGGLLTVWQNNPKADWQIWDQAFIDSPQDPRGEVIIVNRHTGLVLDVFGASRDAGAKVQQFARNDDFNQRWTYAEIG